MTISVATMNGISTIMVRVSSTENIEKQNLLTQNFKQNRICDETPCKKPKSNQKYPTIIYN